MLYNKPESRPDPSERSLDDINDFGTDSSSRGFEDEDRGLDGNMPREIQEAKKNFNPNVLLLLLIT